MDEKTDLPSKHSLKECQFCLKLPDKKKEFECICEAYSKKYIF